MAQICPSPQATPSQSTGHGTELTSQRASAQVAVTAPAASQRSQWQDMGLEHAAPSAGGSTGQGTCAPASAGELAPPVQATIARWDINKSARQLDGMVRTTG